MPACELLCTIDCSELFKELDCDGDGIVTKAEVQKALTGRRKDALRGSFDQLGVSDWKTVFTRLQCDMNDAITLNQFEVRDD